MFWNELLVFLALCSLLTVLVGAANVDTVRNFPLRSQIGLLESGLVYDDDYKTKCKPEHVHVSLHVDPTKMTIMWMTRNEGCHSRVLFANVNSKLEDEAFEKFKPSNIGNVTSIGPSDMCAKPAISEDYPRTWHHAVELDSLTPGEWYWYCPMAADECSRFRASLPAGTSSSFRFVMYGDMGVGDIKETHSPGAGEVMDAVKHEVLTYDSRLVLHIGDISYADGRGDIWHDFMTNICEFSDSVPYMVAVGNHDYDYKGGEGAHDPSGVPPFRPKWGKFKDASGGECGVALARRFSMPSSGAASGENAPFWYSFDYASIHFVVLSSEHNLEAGSEQYAWLITHLSSVDRCKTPWLVVSLHRPLYVIHPHHSNRKVGKHLRWEIEDVLLKYGVDVVMSGHVHSYSRSCPAAAEECVPHEDGGILHVIAGSGGHKLSKVSDSQPEWVAHAERTFGFVRVKVDAESEGSADTLTVEFVAAEDRQVKDSITLSARPLPTGACNFCYTSSGGFVPNLDTPMRGACDPPTDTSDLYALRSLRRHASAAAAVARGGEEEEEEEHLTEEDLFAAELEMDSDSDGGTLAEAGGKNGFVQWYDAGVFAGIGLRGQLRVPR